VAGQLMLTRAHGLRTVQATDGIAAAADALSDSAQAVLPVLDGEGRLAGLISAARLASVLFQHEALDYVRNDRL